MKYIVVLFIILSLSMNAFSAATISDDSSDVALQSTSVDEVAADDQTDGSQNNDGTDNSENTNTDTSEETNTDTSEETNTDTSEETNTNTSDSTNTNDTKPGQSIFGNGSGNGTPTFNFNGTGRGNNSTGIDISGLLDFFKNMMGGNETDNETNETNETTDPEVSDVPAVVTSHSYAPAPHVAKTVKAPAAVTAHHIVQRLRDNTTVSSGDALRLEGINKLYESDFTNGHLLVYVDGKLVFNEITTGDLSTPIFQITDEYLGQHQITAEFTADGNSNTNKYTEDVLII